LIRPCAFFALAIVARALPAQQVPDHSALVAQVAGCYVISLGPWSHTVGDEKTHYTPPDTFRLLATLQVTPTIPYPVRPERGWASWQLVQADSVVVQWNNGFAQAVLTIGRRQGEFRGTLEAISDASSIPPSPPRVASAVLRAVSCRPTSYEQ
jgi:hypothetical protein